LTISLPADLAEDAERAVAAGDAKSVSAYVARALRAEHARRDAFAALERLYGARPSEEALADARRVLGAAADAARRLSAVSFSIQAP
jgi:Arc/MetJ-type ribon-helix-helix transcriptional regulator